MPHRDRSTLKPLEGRLRAPEAPGAAHWARLHRRLAERASAEGLVEVAFERHATPLGTVLLSATAAGLVRVGLPAESEDAVLDELAERVSPRVLHASCESVTRARGQLDEYFERRRWRFDVPLDWRLATGFRRDVLRASTRIPYGRTSTYRELAGEAGRPAASRAAGRALATNPLPILVPCHRVVPVRGGIGGYRGGAAAKALLLDLERADPGSALT